MPQQLSERDIERIVDTVLAEGGGGNLRDYAAIASVIANRADVYGVSPAAIVGPQAEFNGTKPAPGSGKYREVVKEMVIDAVINGNRTTNATFYGMPGHKPTANVPLGEVKVPGATHQFYEPTEPLTKDHPIRAVIDGKMAWVDPVIQPSALGAVANTGLRNPQSMVERILDAAGPVMTSLDPAGVKQIETPAAISQERFSELGAPQGFRQTTPEAVAGMANFSNQPQSLTPRQAGSPHINMEIGKGTIRDDPIQQDVISKVDAIAEHLSAQRGSTITANVTSGGQPAEGREDVDRTGSHRHDNGWSTDFTLSENGVEYVPDQNPGLYADFAGLAAQAGMRGIGVYNHSMHLGTPVEQEEHPGVNNPEAFWNGTKPENRAKASTAQTVLDAVNEGRKQFAAGNVFGPQTATSTTTSVQDPNQPRADPNVPVPTPAPRDPAAAVEQALGAPGLHSRFPGMGDIPERIAGLPSSREVAFDPGRFADLRDGIGMPPQGIVSPQPSVSLPENIPTPQRDPREVGIPTPSPAPSRPTQSQTHPTGSPQAAPGLGLGAGMFNPVDNMATDLMFADQTQAAPDLDPGRMATGAEMWEAGRNALPTAPQEGITDWVGPGSGMEGIGAIPDPFEVSLQNLSSTTVDIDKNRLADQRDEVGPTPNVSSLPGLPGNIPVPQRAPAQMGNVPVPTPAPRGAVGTPAAVANEAVQSAGFPAPGSVTNATGAEFDKLLGAGYFDLANSSQKFTPEQMAPKGEMPDGRGGFSIGRGIGGVIGAILGGALAGPAGSAIGNFLGSRLAGSIANGAQRSAPPANSLAGAVGRGGDSSPAGSASGGINGGAGAFNQGGGNWGMRGSDGGINSGFTSNSGFTYDR